MNENYQTWLGTLQVGDEIMYQETFGIDKGMHTSTIKKITEKGMFRLENDKLFQANGYSFFGGKDSGIRLLPVDEKRLLKATLLTQLEHADLHKILGRMPADKLSEICKLLHPYGL